MKELNKIEKLINEDIKNIYEEIEIYFNSDNPILYDINIELIIEKLEDLKKHYENWKEVL